MGGVRLYFIFTIPWGPPMNPEKVGNLNNWWSLEGVVQSGNLVLWCRCVQNRLGLEKVVVFLWKRSWKRMSLERCLSYENWLALYTKVFEALFHERKNLKERDFSLVQSDKLCHSVKTADLLNMVYALPLNSFIAVVCVQRSWQNRIKLCYLHTLYTHTNSFECQF